MRCLGLLVALLLNWAQCAWAQPGLTLGSFVAGLIPGLILGLIPFCEANEFQMRPARIFGT